MIFMKVIPFVKVITFTKVITFIIVSTLTTRPNEFGSMTTRKDDIVSPIKSIFCYKRPCKTMQDYERP